MEPHWNKLVADIERYGDDGAHARLAVVFEAIDAVGSFPSTEKMKQFCQEYGVPFNELEPPYLAMARIATFTQRHAST